MLDRTNIHSILKDLDRELVGSTSGTLGQRQIIVCGGAAMLSLGIRTTSTMDIDVLEPTLDSTLREAAVIVGKKHGLAANWFNNGPATLVSLLPHDWKTRLTLVFRGQSFHLYALGRPELLLSKVFAEADRQEDLEDILALTPSASEVESAGALVETFDANPNWPQHVRRTVVRIIAALKS